MLTPQPSFSRRELNAAHKALKRFREGMHAICITPAVAHLLRREVVDMVGTPWPIRLVLPC